MKTKREPRLRFATPSDVHNLLGMMREYYAYDHLKFDQRASEKAVKHLLDDERLGRIWMIEEGKNPVGYFVVTFWYSLEFHGKSAFLDELHIRTGYRGRGIGKRALAYVQDYCSSVGVRTLRLEVEHINLHAHNLYRKSGFREHTRHLMTKWLDDSR
jgi:diamine N-acetyltransferase